jgi:hypothetical protein
MAIELGPLIVTGTFTLLAGWGGVALTQKFESNRSDAERQFQLGRDKTADERAIRDRRAERLRRAYLELVALAIKVSATVQGWRWLPRDLNKLSADERSKRIEQLLSQAAADLGDSQIAVLLESEQDSKEVLDTFLRIHEGLQEQVGNVIDQLQQPEGDAGKAAGDLAKRVRLEVDHLSELARAHISRLEKPV